MRRLTSAGKLLWPQDSVRILSSESEPEISLSIINDDSGGLLLPCWERIFCFDLNVEMTWLVADIPGSMTDDSIVSDSDGGAIYYYFNHINFNYKLYIQRVIANGELLWGAIGLFVTTKVKYPALTSIVPDPKSGVYISWVNPFWGAREVSYSSRANFERVFAVSDGKGGAISIWSEVSIPPN